MVFLLREYSKNRGNEAKDITILNVSYDPTRELFDEYNKLFIKYWYGKTGKNIKILSSNGGSGKQARSIIDGLRGDIATLAISYDIDAIAKKRIIDQNWLKEFPNNSCPYNSIIVFLVRKGNPKNIKDWEDLIKKNVQVITPNPKISGGARWNYLAAYGYALDYWQDKEKARNYVKKLFLNTPVLEPSSRSATTTFAKRGLGDVLLTWENEAYLVLDKMGRDKFEIVTPSQSILTEPSVAIVDKVADKKQTREIVESYINFLYSDKGAEIIAKHYYRPANQKILAKYQYIFPNIKLKTVDDFGGWEKFHKEHFAADGVFDRFYIEP